MNDAYKALGDRPDDAAKLSDAGVHTDNDLVRPSLAVLLEMSLEVRAWRALSHNQQ